MKNNMFIGAYFGKPYKTRDGEKVVYIKQFKNLHLLYDKDNVKILVYANGMVYGDFDFCKDIISEWTISEEKLDRLANKACKDLYTGFEQTEGIWKSGFKAGLRAKEKIV